MAELPERITPGPQLQPLSARFIQAFCVMRGITAPDIIANVQIEPSRASAILTGRSLATQAEREQIGLLMGLNEQQLQCLLLAGEDPLVLPFAVRMVIDVALYDAKRGYLADIDSGKLYGDMVDEEARRSIEVAINEFLRYLDADLKVCFAVEQFQCR